jgi:hypothetical protein
MFKAVTGILGVLLVLVKYDGIASKIFDILNI